MWFFTIIELCVILGVFNIFYRKFRVVNNQYFSTTRTRIGHEMKTKSRLHYDDKTIVVN